MSKWFPDLQGSSQHPRRLLIVKMAAIIRRDDHRARGTHSELTRPALQESVAAQTSRGRTNDAEHQSRLNQLGLNIFVVAPGCRQFWSFLYGIKVFGIAEDIPAWLDIRVQFTERQCRKRFRSRASRRTD